MLFCYLWVGQLFFISIFSSTCLYLKRSQKYPTFNLFMPDKFFLDLLDLGKNSQFIGRGLIGWVLIDVSP